MSPTESSRRAVLAQSAALGAAAMLPGALGTKVEASERLRPFRVSIPAREIADLKHRLRSVRWSSREAVSDASQGVQLETLRHVVGYWAGSYDWRRAEAKLNALPQFMTTIDGLDIHFIAPETRRSARRPQGDRRPYGDIPEPAQ